MKIQNYFFCKQLNQKQFNKFNNLSLFSRLLKTLNKIMNYNFKFYF